MENKIFFLKLEGQIRVPKIFEEFSGLFRECKQFCAAKYFFIVFKKTQYRSLCDFRVFVGIIFLIFVACISLT